MSKARKVVFSIVLVIVLAPVALSVAIQFPKVQTSVARAAVSMFASSLDGDISLGKVYYSLPNTVLVKDVCVRDTGGDTAAFVGKILVNISIPSLFTDHLTAHRLTVENASVRLTELLSVFPPDGRNRKPERDTALVPRYLSYSLDRLILKELGFVTGGGDTDLRQRPFAMDYGNVDLRHINLDASELSYSDSLLSVMINNLSLQEACGLAVTRFGGMATLGTEGIVIRDLVYEDADSRLYATTFGLGFSSFGDFSDFCQKVSFDADILPSRLDFGTLRHYAGIEGINLALGFDGHVEGPVADLRGRDFNLRSGTGQTEMNMKFHILGLPDVNETMAGVTIDSCTAYMSDISQIIRDVTDGDSDWSAPGGMASDERLTFRGSLDGLLSDFVAYGRLDTQTMGSVSVDLLSSPDAQRGFKLEGTLLADSFNLGSLLSSDALGIVDGEVNATAILGKDHVRVSLDDLNVFRIGLLGSEYCGIAASGFYDDGDAEVCVRSTDDKFSFALDASLSSNSDGTSRARLLLDSLDIISDGRRYLPGRIEAEGFTSDIMTDLRLTSRVAELRFGSDVPLSRILEMISARQFGGADARLSLEILDFSRVSGLLGKDIHVSDGSSVNLSIAEDGSGEGTIRSDLVAFGDGIISGISTGFALNGDSINVLLSVDSLRSGNLVSCCDTLDIDIVPDSDCLVHARINDSRIGLGGIGWKMRAPSVCYADRMIAVEDFELGDGEHLISASGRLGEDNDDRFTIALKNIDLNLVNFLMGDDSRMGGIVNGTGTLTGAFSAGRTMMFDIEAAGCSLNGELLGDLDLASSWNDADRRLDLSVSNILGDRTPLLVKGWYRPEDRNVSVRADFERMPLSIAGPFLTDVVSDISGALDGSLSLSGPLDSLSVKSRGCRLDSLQCRLIYTQVPYVIDGPISVDDYGVSLDNLTVWDKYGHPGTVSGGLSYDHFRNIRLDTRIKADNILGLNTNASQADAFYGRAFASGDIALSSVGTGMKLAMDITTGRNSTIHIPLSSGAVRQTSLLTFVGGDSGLGLSAYDSLRTLQSRRNAESASSPIEVEMNISATPDAEIQLEINRSTGDVIKARGNGSISLRAGGVDSDFDIRGGYTIDQGSYKFSMFGMNGRDFTIEQGGTISFNGDIMQSELDVNAIYRTKASIAPLIADTTSTSNRRSVECGIGVSGSLSNPEIAFNIDVPDVDPTTKGKVESALSSEDKRMKQFLAVLISGSFLPDEESGIVNNTSILYSNVSEIMASQVNNIFRQLDIPLDFGFNYQPTQSGKDVFDVAISTQLFNNRVIINGNLGNRQYISSSQGELVGDIDMEVKLSRGGQVRLNLFSHSADQYSNYLDQMQRNGAGIVYQEEFDTFGELWRKIFGVKRKRGETEIQTDDEAREIISDTDPAGGL